MCIDNANNQASFGDEFGEAGVAVHISLIDNTLGGRSNLNVKLYSRKIINKYKWVAIFCTRVQSAVTKFTLWLGAVQRGGGGGGGEKKNFPGEKGRREKFISNFGSHKSGCFFQIVEDKNGKYFHHNVFSA